YEEAAAKANRLARFGHQPTPYKLYEARFVEGSLDIPAKRKSTGRDLIVSHHAPYSGMIQNLDQDEKVMVFLDSGILFRCFPAERQPDAAPKSEAEAKRAEAGRTCGRLLFDSLLENPHVAAVVI